VSGATSPSVVRENGAVRIRVPMQLKRRGGRKEVIVPEGPEPRRSPVPRARNPLTIAVARALRWHELLDEGTYPSMYALADKLGVDARYVARLLDLALLAPDIIDAILAGREPDGLSLDKLYRAPMEWEEQRRMIGLPSVSCPAIGP
jgi:hypothetical protein